MIDIQFELPKGSTVIVGRAFHPEPGIPLPGEIIAIPSIRFAQKMKKVDVA